MRAARALTPRDQSGTPMTDIPSYGQFIKSHAPPAPKNESLGDIVAATAKTLARSMQAVAQTLTPQPDEDRAAHRAFVATLGDKPIWGDFLGA